MELEFENGIPRYVEYGEPKINLAEVYRYAGIPSGKALITEELKQSFMRAQKLIEGQLTYKVGYVCRLLPRDEEGFPILPFRQHSKNLKKNLHDCTHVILFAATIGAGIDRLIRRFEVSDPALGMILQGLGAERVESLCDRFNKDVKEAALEKGYQAHPRFSPGFGDLPITVQKDFLAGLDASRRMGITLSESLLMSPSKSVTAIIGLERRDDGE